MKRIALFMSLALLIFSNASAQDFPIGIWFGGNQNSIDAVADMGFTWIQAYGGWDLDINNLVLQNTRDLNVIAIRARNIHNPSFAQRMWYEAEDTDSENGVFNYFEAHPVGDPGTRPGTTVDVWLADTDDPNHAAGYMVQSPDPDNQYFYERMNWVATANISIDPTGNATDQVVRMEIADGANILAQRIITEGEFGGSTAFQEFELAYTLPTPAPPPPKYSYPVTSSQTVQSQHNIDVRIYWYDQVNTYLDYMVLEDSVVDDDTNGAYQLFRGLRDSLMLLDAQYFDPIGTYPLLQRFYLKDEPYYNGYQPFNYVDQMIQSIPGGFDGSEDGRGRGTTAAPNYAQFSSNVYAGFTRFMNDGQPFELFVDHYPILADIPANPSYIPAEDAEDAGIAEYTNTAAYNEALQPAFDYMIDRILLPAIETATSSEIDWWYIAQVHGTVDSASGQYRTCDGSNSPTRRPPSPAEIRAMASLALAYGAKGIFYFAFPTWTARNFNDCASVRFVGLVDEGSEFDTPGHADNYDTFNGNDVFTGYQAKYEAVTEINGNLQILGPELAALDWQSAHNSGDSPGSSMVQDISGGDDVEIGDFTHPTSNEDYFLLVNRRCDNSDTQTITATLASSGSRRLIEDVLASRVPWDGNANRVAYRTLEASETDIVVTLNPGEGRLFRVTSGLSGTVSAARYWSGEPYVEDDLTVSSGVTLTVHAGTAIACASGNGTRITINGSLQAVGTAGDLITFTSAASSPSAGDWDGIFLANGDGSTIDYCTFEYGAFGVYANNPGDLTLQNATIRNGLYGVYVTSTPANTAQILNNLITDNSYYGLYLYNGADPDIGFNTISSNTLDVIRCASNSDPRIRSQSPNPDYGNNSIHDNGGAGVKAGSNSYPQLGHNTLVPGLKDYYGYNEIYGNGSFEVDNSNTSSDSVYAKRNYWSADHEGTPSPSDFNGRVAYNPILGGLPNLVAGAGSNFLSKLSISFEPALKLEIDEQYEEAAKLYLSLLEQNPDADNVGYGVSGVIRCYKGMKQPGRILPALQDLIGAFGGTALESSAKDHTLPFLVHQRDYATALAYADTLLQRNLGVESKEPHYLYQLASIYLAKSGGTSGNDLNSAIANFEQLRQKYPATDFAVIAAYDMKPFTGAGLPRSSPESQPIAQQPQQFELRSNYPNPFNPATMIEFALPEPATVTLKVYNVLGVEVATLLSNQELEAGIHRIDFEAKDLSGGLYFCRLITPVYKETRKMTLLR